MIGSRADMGRKWAAGVGPWLTLILVHLASALEVPLDRKWDLFMGWIVSTVTQSQYLGQVTSSVGFFWRKN